MSTFITLGAEGFQNEATVPDGAIEALRNAAAPCGFRAREEWRYGQQHV
jgi:hypothetical protein